jgi:hypothetical protein
VRNGLLKFIVAFYGGFMSDCSECQHHPANQLHTCSTQPTDVQQLKAEIAALATKLMVECPECIERASNIKESPSTAHNSAMVPCSHKWTFYIAHPPVEECKSCGALRKARHQ